jgi:hypothetical protein
MCLSSKGTSIMPSAAGPGASLRCRRPLSMVCEGLIALDGRSLAAGRNARPFRVETRFD